MKILTTKIPPGLAAQLEQAARERGASKSALVEEAGIDVQVFRDMDEAMMWLQEPAQEYLVPGVFGVPQTL